MHKSWSVPALKITPTVQKWLRQPTAVSLLHLFDEAINLIDTNGTIISIVQPDIGAGPFSIVVAAERPFPDTLNPSTPIRKTADHLHIGPLHIDLRPAALWQPRPHWALLRTQQHQWQPFVPDLQTAVTQQQDRLTTGSPIFFAPKFYAATSAVQTALTQSGPSELATAVAQLAGLGPGLTPAGDDFLLGLLLGLWATRSEAVVVDLAKMVVETAVPRTTQLSAAWLQAAAQGDAAQTWHDLVDALLAGVGWQPPLNKLLQTGATSGIAALLGFITATASRSPSPR